MHFRIRKYPLAGDVGKAVKLVKVFPSYKPTVFFMVVFEVLDEKSFDWMVRCTEGLRALIDYVLCIASSGEKGNKPFDKDGWHFAHLYLESRILVFRNRSKVLNKDNSL